jgi:basic membrane lipoprotein Med (substrate-binding protein (PBP1-ABC) superfamily)
MYPLVEMMIKQINEGKFENIFYDLGMPNQGYHDIAPYHGFEDIIPKDVTEMVEKRRQEIVNETFKVPIKIQGTKEAFPDTVI